VTAAGGDAKATVSWAAPSGTDTGTAHTATAQPGGHTCAASAGDTSCELTQLTNGTAYTVTVRAGNAAGESPPSAPVVTTPAAPSLPATVPAGDGRPDTSGGAVFTPAKRTTTLTGSGFAPNSPVTVGIYSVPAALVSTTSDGAGDVSVEVTIPQGYSGSHTLALSGIAPGGAARVLTLPVTVAAAGTLPVTGPPPVGLLVAVGLGLVGAGAAMLRIDTRSTRSAHTR
jgi:hypothetical protein